MIAFTCIQSASPTTSIRSVARLSFPEAMARGYAIVAPNTPLNGMELVVDDNAAVGTWCGRLPGHFLLVKPDAEAVTDREAAPPLLTGFTGHAGDDATTSLQVAITLTTAVSTIAPLTVAVAFALACGGGSSPQPREFFCHTTGAPIRSSTPLSLLNPDTCAIMVAPVQV